MKRRKLITLIGGLAIAESVRYGRGLDLAARFEIMDADGQLLLTVPFSDAVPVRRI